MLPGGSRIMCMIQDEVLPGLDMNYTDPAHLLTAVWGPDHLSVDDLSVHHLDRDMPDVCGL